MKSRFLRSAFTPTSVFLLAQILQGSPIYAAPPSNDELQRQVLQLQGQVQLLEQRTAGTSAPSRGAVPTAPSIETQLAQLSARVDGILQVLQITSQGVTLQSNRSLTLRAAEDLIIQGQKKTTVESAGTLKIKSAGKSEIEGSLVVFNKGSKPVAFQGGQTAGNANQHIISSGSPTVLVP